MVGRKIIIYTYIIGLAMIILSIIGLRKVIRKENLVEITIFTMVGREEIMENREFFNKILRGLIILFCIMAYIGYIIPAIRDLPKAINGDFCIIEGESIREKRFDDSDIQRNIIIKDKDGKKHKILCDYYEEIDIGDRFKIVYLPNIKIGSVIEHEKNTD